MAHTLTSQTNGEILPFPAHRICALWIEKGYFLILTASFSHPKPAGISQQEIILIATIIFCQVSLCTLKLFWF